MGSANKQPGQSTKQNFRIKSQTINPEKYVITIKKGKTKKLLQRKRRLKVNRKSQYKNRTSTYSKRAKQKELWLWRNITKKQNVIKRYMLIKMNEGKKQIKLHALRNILVNRTNHIRIKTSSNEIKRKKKNIWNLRRHRNE